MRKTRTKVVDAVVAAMVAAYNEQPEQLTPNEDMNVAVTLLRALFERTAPAIDVHVLDAAAEGIVDAVRSELCDAIREVAT